MREPLDIKEVVTHVDSAAGQLAWASECFSDLEAVFEAIIAATESHTLAHRLAKFGMRTAEDLGAEFEGYRDHNNELVRSFMNRLGRPIAEGA